MDLAALNIRITASDEASRVIAKAQGEIEDLGNTKVKAPTIGDVKAPVIATPLAPALPEMTAPTLKVPPVEYEVKAPSIPDIASPDIKAPKLGAPKISPIIVPGLVLPDVPNLTVPDVPAPKIGVPAIPPPSLPQEGRSDTSGPAAWPKAEPAILGSTGKEWAPGIDRWKKGDRVPSNWYAKRLEEEGLGGQKQGPPKQLGKGDIIKDLVGGASAVFLLGEIAKFGKMAAQKLLEASPMLQSQLKMMDIAVNRFLRPLGDSIAKALAPLTEEAIRKAEDQAKFLESIDEEFGIVGTTIATFAIGWMTYVEALGKFGLAVVDFVYSASKFKEIVEGVSKLLNPTSAAAAAVKDTPLGTISTGADSTGRLAPKGEGSITTPGGVYTPAILPRNLLDPDKDTGAESIYNWLGGKGRLLPWFAAGGDVPYKPGGTIIGVAEREDETIVPKSQRAAYAAKWGGGEASLSGSRSSRVRMEMSNTFIVQGNVYGDDIEARMQRILNGNINNVRYG